MAYRIISPYALEKIVRMQHNRPRSEFLFGRDYEMRKILRSYPKCLEDAHLKESLWLGAAVIMLLLTFYSGMLQHWSFFLAGPLAIAFLVMSFKHNGRRTDLIHQLNKLRFSLGQLESWSGKKLEALVSFNDDQMLKLMNRLMLEVVEPVYDLQEHAGEYDPLEYPAEHAKLMSLVTERFDTLKILGYMPEGGYGLFFQHIRFQRDGEPEKFILAT